ncbi:MULTISPECIES: hypothetical protein [Moraxella]|uniref:Uncharacterized protein n=1 Tax=Moraxella catarrhalis TaxID=480 RepID=A0A198UDW2_MORCA|nr:MULTISPECIES: hypothetical protein [Moraxella]OAU94574.1 hypothetical protein AO384_1931 [Moraxella catarrhalis]OAU95568.1 hypothetical protein AO385_1992 [Moraxella catarrhalis]OAU96822.1 hypothetical protein AO383_1339 [Moraxella catarrhalis]OAV02159.1 hypothetical protein AO382_0525 [Moraxella catarrhalis]STY81948.1 Uncharacterised protein [Moraxella catarrhalis]
MLIYFVSAVIFFFILSVGLYITRRHGVRSEKVIVRLCLIGFLCQILINWLFWGDGVIYNPFSATGSVDRTGLTFLVLCLISIFCYASLLMLLYKANDFYNE